MTGTLVVLVIGFIVCVLRLLVALVALAACTNQAKRNGQSLKSMSWSFRHGLTAEFYEPQSGNN
jgi:hypothetical protein